MSKSKELYESFIELGDKCKNELFKKQKLSTEFFRPRESFSYDFINNVGEFSSDDDNFIANASLIFNTAVTWRNCMAVNTDLRSSLNEAYKSLVEVSYQERFMFPGANNSIHIKTLNQNIEESINIALGKTRKHLFECELKKYKKHYRNMCWFEEKGNGAFSLFDYDKEKVWPYLFLNRENEDMLGRFLSKTISFLENHGDYNSEQTIENEEPLENITAKYKVLLLNEVGFIDTLFKKTGMNPNKASEILSKITGEKSGTLVKCIRAVRNPDSGHKDDPYGNNDDVKKAKKFLSTKI